MFKRQLFLLFLGCQKRDSRNLWTSCTRQRLMLPRSLQTTLGRLRGPLPYARVPQRRQHRRLRRPRPDDGRGAPRRNAAQLRPRARLQARRHRQDRAQLLHPRQVAEGRQDGARAAVRRRGGLPLKFGISEVNFEQVPLRVKI